MLHLLVVVLIGLFSGSSRAEVEPLHPQGIAGPAQVSRDGRYGGTVTARCCIAVSLALVLA